MRGIRRRTSRKDRAPSSSGMFHLGSLPRLLTAIRSRPGPPTCRTARAHLFGEGSADVTNLLRSPSRTDGVLSPAWPEPAGFVRAAGGKMKVLRRGEEGGYGGDTSSVCGRGLDPRPKAWPRAASG